MPGETPQNVLLSRLLCACLPLLLLLSAPAQAAEKGTVPDVTWGASRSDVDRTVALMSDAGVRWARLNVSWAAIEPHANNSYDPASLADLDYAVAKVRAAGIAVVMPVADSVPFWASGDPGKVLDALGRRWNKRYRPASMADYADFFAFVARRYAPSGVHVFEVWNEPNLLQFWPSGVNAAEYKLMLQAAHGAIKSADPQSTVLVGGLSQHDRDFLAQLYAAGGRPYFDAVGDHTYPWGDPANCWNDGSGKRSRDTICGIEEVRRVMEANGDAAKQIWITEMGWTTYSGSGGVTEAQQADYLVKGYRRLESYPYVRAALQYSFRNVVARAEDPFDDMAHLGLLRIDFSRKPAYYAFKGYTPGSGYARPQGIASTRVWLVPALEACSTPNRVHGPALSFGSCTPPRPASDYATVGTLDRNGQPSNAAGFIRYRPMMGDPSTAADEADVAIRVSMLDVRVRGSLGDYAGELEARVPLRLTDRGNGPSASETGTVQNHSFAVTVPCSGTADTTVGATCSLATTADAVLPSVVKEGDRAIWELGQIRLFDGGPDRDASTHTGNTLFAAQGLFVP